MKKSIVFTLCIVFVLLFSACTGLNVPTEKTEVIEYFECDLSVTANEKEYYCHFERTQGETILTVEKPEEINGLAVSYKDGVYTVGFKGISMSLDDSESRITKHFADGLIQVLEDTFSLDKIDFKSENNLLVYNGDNTFGGFKIYFNADGTLSQIEIPSIATVIKVENFSLGNAAE